PSPLAIENTANPWAIGRRKAVVLANSWSMWIGLKSPLKPAKLTMSASVIVRPPEVHSWPTSRSSKYRWMVEKLMNGSRDGKAGATPRSFIGLTEHLTRCKDRRVRAFGVMVPPLTPPCFVELLARPG